MIVLDASAIVELLLRTPPGEVVAKRIEDAWQELHTPELASLEVIQTLRRLEALAELNGREAAFAVQRLQDLDLAYHSHPPLLDRVWQMRRNLSAYDAVYLALAEALGTKLLTCDGRLARSSGASGRVEHVDVRTM